MEKSNASCIPEGYKFACIAMGEPGQVGIDEPLNLPSGITVFRQPPIELEEHWIKWIGTQNADRLRRCELALVASSPSREPGAYDGENEQVLERARRTYHGMLLLGAWGNAALHIAGARVSSSLRTRHIGVLHRDTRPPRERSVHIDEGFLRRADELGLYLADIYSQTSLWRRLKRGFHVWLRGSNERDAGERLHDFVRSLEGLMKTPAGASKTKFAHRLQTIIGASTPNQDLGRELYELRSCAEHIHDWDCGLEDLPVEQRQEHSLRRVLQSELISAYAYTHIIQTRALREAFATDNGIESFWRLEDNDRRELWGAPFDLEGAMEQRYTGPS